MTTANLSVGIKTAAVKSDLLSLKSWMKNEMKGISIGVDTNAIQAELKKRRFEVTIDSARLTQQVTTALSEAFAHTHEVRINRASLTAQVQAAVSGGMTGTLSGGGSTTGFGDIRAAITQTLMPAVEALAKAADVMGANARRAGLAGASSSNVSASRSYSATDPETGFRTSYRQKLENPAQALAGAQGINAVAAQQATEAAEARVAQADSNRLYGFRRSFRRAQETAEAAQAREEQADANRTFAMRRNFTRANESAVSAAAREEQTDANRTFAMRRSFARAADSAEASEAREAQSDANRTFAMRRSFRRAQETAEAAQAREEQADANRTFAMRRQFARSQEQQQRTANAATFAQGTFAGRSQYTGVGTRIAGAQALVSSVGEEGARAHLGSASFLVDEIKNLENYRKAHVATVPAITKTISSHRELQVVLDDVKGGFRGLAGTLGQTWITFGSVAPLIAAAALGTALKSVVTAGADVEYQLRFVQVLSDNTTVSIEKFGNAVRGSLVMPTEAAAGMRGLAQNGLGVREALQALPAILNLATAGELSLSDAALGATGVMAAFNLEVSDLGRIGDVFAKAAAISNTSVQEMVEAMKQASTVADKYHVSLETTAAGLATLAQMNIRGTAAGTAYRNMWVELATPTKKAQQQLEQLHLELFNSNGQLKDSATVMDMLSSKLVVLDEKSRLAALHNIFNERGEKAANAILSNLDEYKNKLGEVTEKSKDFTQSVTAALNDTATGKFKAMMSEFQLSAVSAFYDSSNAVKNFLDNLRKIAGSKDFQQTLLTVTEAVVNLTNFLVEHGKVILLTVGIWKATQWASAAVLGFQAIATAIKTAEIGMVAFGVAGRAAMAMATSGISLIIALGVEYFLLRDKTDAATESQKAFTSSLEAEADRLDRSSKALQDRLKFLDLTIKYQKEGMSVAEAKRAAESETSQQGVTNLDDEVKKHQLLVSGMKGELALIQAKNQANLAAGRPLESYDRGKQLKASIETESRNVADLLANRNKAEKEFNLKNQVEAGDFQSKRLGQIRDFNKKVGDALKEDPKLKMGGLAIGADAPTDRAQFDKYMADKEAAFNANAVKLPALKSTKGNEAHREEMANSRALMSQLTSEENALKQGIRFRKELDDARFPLNQFGPYMAAALAEQRQIEDTSRLIDLQTRMVQKLTAEKNKNSALNGADKINIQTEIDKRNEQINLDKALLDHQKQIAAIRADARAQDEKDANTSALRKLSGKDEESLSGIRKKYDTKIVDPGQAAQMEAAFKVEENYRERITQQEQDLLVAERSLKAIRDDIGNASYEELITAQARVGVQEMMLNLTKSQSDVAKVKARSTAQSEYDRSQTAEYGFSKFWEEYRASAESNSKIVYDIMKSTTTGMTDLFATFVTTGKLNFKSFAASIVAEAARILATKAIVQLLTMAGSMFAGGSFGSVGSTGAAGGFNGSAGSGFGATYSANGNIMTSRGPLPLRKYENGGIANSAQASIFGEGRRPEAYVPLPDGRTIPVTMSGDGSGGGGSPVTVSMNINIATDGNSKVQSDVSGEKAAQMGETVKAAVLTAIRQEQRPGGLLYAH